MADNHKIVKKHLILCEGVDEYKFFIAWLNNDNLKDNDFFSDEIQVMDFGGNEQLSAYISVLIRSDQFDHVKSILIVRDAEKDEEKAINDVKGALNKNDLPVPNNIGEWFGNDLKIAFLLLPSLDNNPCKGTLEDLCVELLSEKDNPQDVIPLVENLLENLKKTGLRNFPHKHKSKLHTYFSVTDKYISAKIGEAAQWGAFNWKSEKLKYIEELIEQVSTYE